MGSLSVSLNHFSSGSQRLEPAQIYSSHVDSTEKYLNKIFREHFTAPKNQTGFKVKFHLDKPVLCYQGQEVPLEKSPELKRIARTVRYYQLSGKLSKIEQKPEFKEQAIKEAKKSIKEVHEASIPGSNGQILAGMRVADDTLSLIRNILCALPDIGPNDSIVSHLGYYAGISWTFFAIRELDNGLIEHKRSKVIGDEEGIRRSEARILSGGIVSTASFGYLMGKICNTYISQGAAAISMGVSNVLFGIGSFLAMGVSLVGALRCHRFNDRLNEYYLNTKLPEVERVKAALKFLKECIVVTPEEREELIQQIEKDYPDWSNELKEKLLKQKLVDLTETKVKYMKRRTSSRSLLLILRDVDNILAKLENSKTVVEGGVRATELINTIQKESRLKQTLYVLGFVAALVSFVAMLLLTFGSFGMLPFVLYGITGTIYLLITAYTVAGMVLKKDPKAVVEVHPVEEMPHLRMA